MTGRAATGLLLVATLVGGCASGLKTPSPDADAPPTAVAADYDRQALYRVEIESPEGDGRLRLVARDGDDGFQLLASDPFGRALWTLSRLSGTTWLVDHRAAAWCRAADGVSLPDLELAGLPIDRVPSILAGEAPVATPPAGADGPFVDGEGRRWSVEADESGVRTWTLWRDGEPLLWWLRQPRGGILSHRRGSQIRWRSSLVEETPGQTFTVSLPQGYDRLDCAAWDLPQLRQDQPPSAGDRPPA